MEAGTPKPDGDEKAKPNTGSQPLATPQTPQEQIDGLRAWLAQLDRRLRVRSWAGGLAIVLALAAGIVGVVLAMQAKDDSATKAEVTSLRDQVSASTEEATQSVQDQVRDLSDQLDELEGRISTLSSNQRTTESEIQVVQDDIDDLRRQLTDVEQTANQASDTADAARTAADNNSGN